MDLLDKLYAGHTFFADGGMGTLLQKSGLQPGEIPELWNLSHKKVIASVHSDYFKAGSDYVCTNTFGANRVKYHGDIPLSNVITSAVEIARNVAEQFSDKFNRKFVALDVGPTGKLLVAGSGFSFNEAYDAFAEEITIGAAAGADLIAVETMGDTYELKAAVLAARENSTLPVFATVSVDETGKLLTGADVETVALLLEKLGVTALGLNCGVGPDKVLPFVRRLTAFTSLPVIVKMNAGLPRLINGKTQFDIYPVRFAKLEADLVEAGASIAGGCCGTTPEYIAELVKEVRTREKDGRIRTISEIRHNPRSSAFVSSGTHTVEISVKDSVVIGERINPTGKKKLKEALVTENMPYILSEAVSEAEAGAHILDVNVGVPGIDEEHTLVSVVNAVQEITDLPLQLDTSDTKALESALRIYNGVALVNSVNGKEESLNSVLPAVKKYGGVVVALTLDENGIPPTAEGRLAIARKILARGMEFGLSEKDFIIDPLCLSVSAEPQSGMVVLESLRRIKSELGVPTVLGVSNISFGLPSRPVLNSVFYSMALSAGLSAAILNPLAFDMMAAFYGYRALVGKDQNCGSWIKFAQMVPQSGQIKPQPALSVPLPAADNGVVVDPSMIPLVESIRRGLKDNAVEAVRILENDPAFNVNDVIEKGIVVGLEIVGNEFEKSVIFLPQLLMSAQAATAAVEEIKKLLPAGSIESNDVIVLATVKGDIHDIGKNIVKALLETHGFKVIDLGRDVQPELIVETACKTKCALVGLSALMTTTAPAMEETINLIHKVGLKCQVVVGGAVITAEYAEKIGADYYSKDAMQTVRIAKKIFKK